MRKETYWSDPRFKGIVPFESKKFLKINNRTKT